MKIGICQRCGGLATQNCKICGAVVCIKCTTQNGCKICEGRKKI